MLCHGNRGCPFSVQAKYIVPKYSKKALAGDWVLMWQDTGAVFRLRLGEDLMFESVGGVGSGQLGGRWNLWGADRFVCFCARALRLPSLLFFPMSALSGLR